MHTERCCTKCGAPLTSVGLEELCPGCLLEVGLGATRCAGSLDGDAPTAVKPDSPLVGRFGNYELLEEIARGVREWFIVQGNSPLGGRSR